MEHLQHWHTAIEDKLKFNIETIRQSLPDRVLGDEVTEMP